MLLTNPGQLLPNQHVYVIAALFGSTFFTLIVLLSVTYWPTTARLVRAEVMSIKEKSFIEAARAMGASPARILYNEILPNALPLIITNTVLMVGGIILVEAGLESIGLGDSNYVSWGYMLHNGEHFIRDAWWIIFFRRWQFQCLCWRSTRSAMPSTAQLIPKLPLHISISPLKRRSSSFF